MSPPSFTVSAVRASARSPQADDRLVRLAVAHAKQGSRSALQFLYVRYAADTHRYVRSIVGDHHEAEDITQSVFVKLMPSLSNYEPCRAPFGAWLRRVARNAALDTMRGRRATPTRDVEVDDPPEREHHVDLVESMKQAFAQPPHEQREVLILRGISSVSAPARLRACCTRPRARCMASITVPVVASRPRSTNSTPCHARMSSFSHPLACVMGNLDLVRPLGLAGISCAAVAPSRHRCTSRGSSRRRSRAIARGSSIA